MNTTDRIFDFIVEYKTRSDGTSPTIREIAIGCKIKSTNTVYYHLVKLCDQKRIAYGSGRFRYIEVIGGKWSYEPEELI